MKHAMTVQSAHMVTTDYVALSQLGSLSEGILLNDRTERKLKLVHSLGELLPMHHYTTEVGNTVERPTKYMVLLAGEIEIGVETDEIDFDAEMGKLALGAEGSRSNALKSSSVPQAMKMSSYAAFANPTTFAASACKGNGDAAGSHGDGQQYAGAVASGLMTEEEATERLQEDDALARIRTLVERVQEMQSWFDGVKQEAERERSLREQTAARLEFMQERVEMLYNQMGEVQRENRQLRQRLLDVGVALEDGAGSVDGSVAAPSVAGSARGSVRSGSGITPSLGQHVSGSGGIGSSLLSTPMSRKMQGFSNRDLNSLVASSPRHQNLSAVKGDLPSGSARRNLGVPN